MKIIFKGRYDGNPESIPTYEHEKNANKIKEFDDMNKFGIIMNVVSFVFIILLGAIYVLVAGGIDKFSTVGFIVPFLLLFPHEIVHAICFKEESYVYTNLKSGMLFVAGPERMSRSRAIFMALLPNLLFGFLPFVAFLINPNLHFLGTIGFISIPMGIGDYYNVFNILTQTPKGSKIYMHRLETYWFLPEME